MSAVPGRALHYVFKIGDRGHNAFFFRSILGMQVLRHEEFKEGCNAECNGPYNNRWSKTMVGYGPESSHFVIELTYNYGVKSYELGNDFGGLTIRSSGVLARAAEHDYPLNKEGDLNVLSSPDGYKFYIIDEEEAEGNDPVKQVALNVTNLDASRKYWQELLQMEPLEENGDKNSLVLRYDGQNGKQAALCLRKINEPLNRAQAYGRIAFAVPGSVQEPLHKAVKAAGGTILKPLITLDTPGKATVSVLILADPDGHEICFVDEEGFGELSQVEPDGEKRLDKYIAKDPFQSEAYGNVGDKKKEKDNSAEEDDVESKAEEH
ncbi:glyoxalase domain-containing protein 4 [Scaptodrosophila lebanonensis]|uniref:Glyoxalase domain-containing protein 4 n=1 Tax=Drosophila lebanonensis TaxID=7225 RepID=A0A6J2TV99_DROLE|nr:glyoxalase domain-containing protein 4 [Scaptodrosophila lebanonensis]